MKKQLLTLLLSLFITPLLFAQTEVSGVVTDGSNNEPFAFANVYVKNTTVGTTTDMDGIYRISVPSDVSNPIIVFQFMGYTTLEKAVNGSSSMNVTLEPDAEQLDEVVVTSFGIKRERKALNYAVQDLKSDELSKSKEANVVNSLRGKVAGVQVTASSGSPGASSQILIRGASSVSSGGNNQPLFIVDGIIISNAVSQGGGGNGSMDIDPDDIASMTVLKGPAAAALYGWNASNGAIVITTKSGAAGKIKVDFGTDIGFSTPFATPNVQDKFMQGTQGYYTKETPSSWGPILPANADKYDNVNSFLGTGVLQKYNVSVSGGTSKLRALFSGNIIDQTGVVPVERYQKMGGLLKLDYQPFESFTIGASTNLVKSHNDRVPYGFMSSMYRWPINRDMSVFENENGEKDWLLDGGASKNFLENPNWWSKYNSIQSDILRTISSAYINWDITEDLNFNYRIGYDKTFDNYSKVVTPNSAGGALNEKGYSYENPSTRDIINSNAIISYSKELTDRINIGGLVGTSLEMSSVKGDYYNIGLERHVTSTTLSRGIGAFGSLRADFDDTYFVEGTLRNDWSSTLSPGMNSFMYPSITLGAIVSEYFSEDFKRTFSYLKLRGNYAGVGKATGAEKTRNKMENYPGIGEGYNYFHQGGNWFIKPELTFSYEFGFELRLWEGKTHLDVTYYNMTSNNQIITGRVSPTSGFVIMTFNAGSITNKGIEAFLNQTVVETDDFKWDLGLNFSNNKSQLNSLPEYMSKMLVPAGDVYSGAMPSSEAGKPVTGIDGIPFLRNKDGKIVIDEDGLPRYGTYQVDDSGNYIDDKGEYKVENQSKYLGNREPDFILGISNGFTYKNWDFSFLFDYRNGGDVINATAAKMTTSGMSEYVGQYRNKTTVVSGVVEQPDGSFIENTQEIVMDRTYFTRLAQIGENFVEDGSWFRLRNVRVGYAFDLPKDNFVNRLNLAFTANNLWMWSAYSGADPETNYGGAAVGGSGTQGVDYFNTPSVTSYSFNIKASF